MPTPVTPRLIRFNAPLATELNIEFSDAGDEELAQVFSGNLVPHNADPLAMAYSGHQFGNLNPQLRMAAPFCWVISTTATQS